MDRKRLRFTKEQTIGILREQVAGQMTADVCRRHGVSEATFYKWKSTFGGMDVSDAKRPKALEAENARLKKLRRLYREEGLQVRIRGGRKRTLGTRALMLLSEGPNQRWSLYFVSDAFDDGRLRDGCLIEMLFSSLSHAHSVWALGAG